MRRKWFIAAQRFLAVAACAQAIVACAVNPEASPAARERLFYELEVTSPGTRSQGVRGRLYARDGSSIALAEDGSIVSEAAAPALAVVDPLRTNAGAFTFRPRLHLWDVSGMIAETMLPVTQMNNPSVRGPHRFRLYVINECAENEAWRGELTTPEGVSVAAHSAPLETPMGDFAYRTGPPAAAQTGWFPIAWPAPLYSQWPCSRSH